MVLQQMKVLLLSVIALLRRALCCFSRRRKHSHSGTDHDGHTLQGISVVVEPRNNCPTGGAGTTLQYKERDWNSWDDSPRTVEEHIEQYRQRMALPTTPPKEEPEPDFFSELTPNIKPQPKYYLGDANVDTVTDTAEKSHFSRLQAQTDVPITLNADLEDWVDDNGAGGWEELDSEQARQLIREKRREARSNRQQQSSKVTNALMSGTRGVGATRLPTDAQRSA